VAHIVPLAQATASYLAESAVTSWTVVHGDVGSIVRAVVVGITGVFRVARNRSIAVGRRLRRRVVGSTVGAGIGTCVSLVSRAIIGLRRVIHGSVGGKVGPRVSAGPAVPASRILTCRGAAAVRFGAAVSGRFRLRIQTRIRTTGELPE